MPGNMPESGGGRIEIICGCMFAGKTSHLIARLAEEEAVGRRVAAFKHQLDKRYDPACLVTHNGRSFMAAAMGEPEAIPARIDEAEVVGIDEAHFFGRPLIGVCRQLADAGRHVILAGLDRDAWGQAIPPLPQLKPIADAVTVLHAPCKVCGRPARFSQRLTPVVDGQMVGGPEEYEPRCEVCFTPLPLPAPVY